jgi:hypothetical protein
MNRNYWPVERQGYSNVPRPAYAAVTTNTSALPPRHRRIAIRTEGRIAGLIMLTGIVWIARTLIGQESLSALRILGLLPPGPLEITGIGALIWLHAQWRRSVNLN